MLDENLPTFILKPSKDQPKQLFTFLYSQYGSEFTPAYTLKKPDTRRHDAKNRYAAALYDAYNSDVLFAEVLLIPEWTQQTLNAEVIRQNGGVPPPPEPILPSQFIIQLYNPDQQIVVRHKPASWNSSPTWEFEIPIQTFRTPSGSVLDRTQHDPAAAEFTPKISLSWKKDSKLSKELVCVVSGKTSDHSGKKKKSKEPDIAVAIMNNLKEITLYESNLQRVDIEDMKGFEVVLLLGANVIRDVYFGSMKDAFNIGESRKGSNATSPISAIPTPSNTFPIHSSSTSAPTLPPRVPPTDPRSQWELEAETTRLRQQSIAEAKQRKAREEEAEKKTRKFLEEEERARQRRQAEIDKETERLQRMYGQSQIVPNGPPRDTFYPRHSSDASQSAYMYQQNQAGGYLNGPYTTAAASQSSFLSPQNPPRIKQKSSIFNFRRHSDQDPSRLQKKRSAIF